MEALARHVMSGDVLHADDTPVPVLAPGTGRTRTGRLWAYLRDERPHGSKVPPAVLYRYSPDRKAEHPRVHLRDFRGVLQAHGYGGFEGLYEGGRVVCSRRCLIGANLGCGIAARPEELASSAPWSLPEMLEEKIAGTA